MNKRSIIGLVSGSVLGVFCILGVNYRMGDQVNGFFLFATWLNRLIMGLLIGFYLPASNRIMNSVIRGAFLGLLVSLSFYVATDFLDLTGFIAGIFYGAIIDVVCTKYGKVQLNQAP